MDYKEYALREFELAGWNNLEESSQVVQNRIMDNILELVSVFSKQNHSGLSASYVLDYFEKLVRFKPITPLTGEDSEWEYCYESNKGNKLFQNKRCSHVFKSGNITYDSGAYLFEDEKGNIYKSGKSFKLITFPYIPEPKYVPSSEEANMEQLDLSEL